MPETTSTGSTVARQARDVPSGADAGWAITNSLLSGILLWGGVGWLLSRWTDNPWFFALGVLLGAGLGIYLVIIKYGNASAAPRAGDADTPVGRRSRTGTQKGRR